MSTSLLKFTSDSGATFLASNSFITLSIYTWTIDLSLLTELKVEPNLFSRRSELIINLKLRSFARGLVSVN